MDTTLRRRTANSYASHKKRARTALQSLDYTANHLRKKVEEGIYCPCRYCKGLLTPDNFACDHDTPVGRGGSFCLWNVEVICSRCNLAKGVMSGDHFGALMAMAREWPHAEYVDLLARLRAGGKRFRGRP